MRKTYAWSLGIAIAITAWLGSGLYLNESKPLETSIAEKNSRSNEVAADKVPTNVKAASSVAREVTRYATVSGITQNKRTVTTRTEATGRITSRPIERGDAVKAGDSLCEISIEDKQANVNEAEQRLAQARIDFTGAQRLRRQGFNSESAIAAAKTTLAHAQANMKRSLVQLSKTKVTAPFDGIIESVHLETGDYVTPGQACATIIDLDPMLLTARVSQKEVIGLKRGLDVGGTVDGRDTVRGTITFVGNQSDSKTRTYPIEVQFPNGDGRHRSGLSAEIDIPMDTTFAHQISAALLALDDRGDIGIRIVDEESLVQFYNVDVVAEDEKGIWVSGLPYKTDIITVGQELVVAGERVSITYEDSETTAGIMSNTVGVSSSVNLTK